MIRGRLLPKLVACAALMAGLGLAGTASAQVRDAGEVCAVGATEWAAPAVANAISFGRMEWAPFSATEFGWETYLPLIQKELGTDCAPNTPRFARALADFQYARGLPPTGWFDAATFQVFRGVWQERRPFIMARVNQQPCPDPPPLYQLGYLVESEEHADRLTRLLRRDVLDAYRRLVAAARAEVPEVAANPELLQIFSGFRDPEADAARCAQQGNCDGLRRAACSPHRTGTAVDLYVGQAPGLGVDNTSASSRLHMSRTETYRWLVKNAGRFGFVPYVYEPWHWEWVSPTGGYVGAPPPT
ncbi:D-alanyl-D-alanine carboxypeptidase family protein [Brevundimonas sp. GCM10030266]|uniref:D-alanyl-D-alanine carboxypeptidase family protein n=1 Tax=Brevundimonas sp. GCM10030266 TaxID=3273386 RepID=UPI0036083E33